MGVRRARKEMFDLSKIPEGTPIEWAEATNRAVIRLRARKVEHIDTEAPDQLAFCCRWAEIYIQAHIRRGLSLLESGVHEISAGRTLAAALCARALLEDAALLHLFNRDVLPLLEKRDSDGLDKLVFPRALATRQKEYIEEFGEEIRARNILTAIDKMAIHHPNVRPIYDVLSEVCHPNSSGLVWHFADIADDEIAVFDDGQRMSDAALHHLIFCGLVFAAEDTAIGRVQSAIDAIMNDPQP